MQLNPDFVSYINKFDVIGFQETKTDSLDSINLENFTLLFKHRKYVARKKSGGLCIAIRNDLLPFISVIETDCNLVLWFTLSKKNTKAGDILYGVVYLPPENSSYAPDDPFTLLQNEIDSHTKFFEKICLFGDFNCRTKKSTRICLHRSRNVS